MTVLGPGPVASEDTDETREELDTEVDHDTAGTYSIKVGILVTLKEWTKPTTKLQSGW